VQPPPGESLYLNRRAFSRVEFRRSFRFVSDPTHPLRLSEGLFQNLSLQGAQILTSVVPHPRKPFDVWIQLDSTTILPANAKTAWMAIEDSLSDGPFWVRAGIQFTIPRSDDRASLSEYCSRRLGTEATLNKITDPKIGYVF
jgi:hypothetical protein